MKAGRAVLVLVLLGTLLPLDHCKKLFANYYCLPPSLFEDMACNFVLFPSRF